MYQPATPREFVKAWQESSSVAEVSSKVRSKKNACKVRAYRYRKMGVPLKEFPPVEMPEMDWDDLAAYAKDVLKEARRRSRRGSTE
jgi:hypothetical protein